MTIRKAQPQEASVLTQIAREAQRYSGFPDHWISYLQSDASISVDFITRNQVYVAEESGQLKGFYALVGDQPVLEQLWIAPAHFGTGVGKELFLHAMEQTMRQ